VLKISYSNGNFGKSGIKISTKSFDKEPFSHNEMLENCPKATLLFMMTSLITQWHYLK